MAPLPNNFEREGTKYLWTVYSSSSLWSNCRWFCSYYHHHQGWLSFVDYSPPKKSDRNYKHFCSDLICKQACLQLFKSDILLFVTFFWRGGLDPVPRRVLCSVSWIQMLFCLDVYLIYWFLCCTDRMEPFILPALCCWDSDTHKNNLSLRYC